MLYKWVSRFFLCSVVFIAGCMPSYSIEDRAIVHIMGYDYIEDGEIKGTVAIPQYGRSEESTATELYLNTTADSPKNLSMKLEGESSKPLSIGKLEIVLFSEELANNDITDFLDILSRDARIGRGIYMGVVKGDTQELIEGEYSEDETTAKYLNGLIENNYYKNIPQVNLHRFLYAYHAKGMDGYLPILKKENGNIRIDGISFFKGGKLKFSVPFDKTLFFKVIRESTTRGEQRLNYEGGNIYMNHIRSNVSYRIEEDGNNPKISVQVNLRGSISEMENLKQKKKNSPSFVKELEQAYIELFEKESSQLIKKFQEENVDPIGFGMVLDRRSKEFNMDNWKKLYPEAQISVNFDVKIVETGITN